MLKAILLLVCAAAAINWGLLTVLKVNFIDYITPNKIETRKFRDALYVGIGIIGVIVFLDVFGKFLPEKL